MATNKERIENLEAAFGDLRSNYFHCLELGVTDKLPKIEDSIKKLSDTLSGNQTSEPSNNIELSHSKGRSRGSEKGCRDNVEGGKPMFAPQLATLKFPKFAGEDPTVWCTRVQQFFDYQLTSNSRKVPLVSFHLEGEASEWWQSLKRAY